MDSRFFFFVFVFVFFPTSDARFCAMPFRHFDYQLYVLFSVLYMRKSPIKQGK